MADKHGSGEVGLPESSTLRSEIVELITKRLVSVSKKPREDEIARALVKRRKKWRKRHKQGSQPGEKLVLQYANVSLADEISAILQIPAKYIAYVHAYTHKVETSHSIIGPTSI